MEGFSAIDLWTSKGWHGGMIPNLNSLLLVVGADDFCFLWMADRHRQAYF